jgi:Zn-dependent M28 family amino/carboxypeptidase
LLFGHGPFDAPLPTFEIAREAWPGAERVSFRVEARQNAQVEAANVLGRVRGTARPDSVLLVTAHLDGLGALGPDAYFPGANDNASGVAMLLALAESIQREPLRYTVVFAALGGEESGLKGAFHLAEHSPVPLEQIRFLLNFDMVASAEDGLLVFGGRDQPAEYALLERLNAEQGDGPLSARPNRANSDHWAFTERGVPAFYLLTKDGQQPYHSLRDVPGTLEWDDFARALRLADAFLREL